ncbi:MAG: molybdopterin molybdotransferase MoeA, partial [Phycisphaerae bacterium]
GTLLTPLDIGVAATVGAANLTVYHRPTVAILSTGDELVDVHETPSGAQIRNSNLYLLQAMVRSAHAVQVTLGAVADDRELLRARVAEGLKSDVVCISGGVSVGPLDYVPEILERCGATLHIRKLAIKPGRPLIFGTTSDGTLVFGLPGNPTSAFVCFELLVKPALAALQGRGPCKPRAVRATLCGSVKPTGHRRAFVPARASVDDDGRWRVSPVPWGGSGDSIGLANANGLIVRSPNTIGVSNGEEVLFIPLDRV